jgi:hypothetical protein
MSQPIIHTTGKLQDSQLIGLLAAIETKFGAQSRSYQYGNMGIPHEEVEKGAGLCHPQCPWQPHLGMPVKAPWHMDFRREVWNKRETEYGKKSTDYRNARRQDLSRDL